MQNKRRLNELYVVVKYRLLVFEMLSNRAWLPLMMAKLNCGGAARQGTFKVFEAVDFYCLLFMVTVRAVVHG